MNLNRFNWIGLKKKWQLTGLKGVHIEACQLETLTKDNFGSLRAWMIRTLTIVSSDDGPLQTINADVFTDWISLRMLTITKSQIKSIEWAKLLRTDLWYLDLSDNYIETIPNDLFKSLPKLKELNLDNNNIKTLSWQQLLPGLSRLTTFSINGEPNKCELRARLIFIALQVTYCVLTKMLLIFIKSTHNIPVRSLNFSTKVWPKSIVK